MLHAMQNPPSGQEIMDGKQYTFRCAVVTGKHSQ